MDNLDEFLKGDIGAPEAVEATETETQEAAQPTETADEPKGPVRDEKGRFAPKGETEAASPAAPEPPLDHAALIGERRRRQEAEQRIAEYEARLAQIQAPQPQVQQQPQTQGPPDRWEDPEGYDRWLVAQAANTARQEAMAAFQYQRIETSATQYRAQVPDYDEKIQVFGQMVQANPALLEQLQRAGNPAEYAYNAAKTQMEISQYGGIDQLINARIEEALKAKQPTNAAPPVPDTLADAQSARGSTTAGGFHVPSFDEILSRNKA